MSKPVALVHKGLKFAGQGSGRYAKDVVKLGRFVHPEDGRIIDFTPERLASLELETTRYLGNGNKIPFPDGHSWNVLDNMGFWPGPFTVVEGALFGVVEPKEKKAIEKLEDGSLDAVSVVIEFDKADTKGNRYGEVITQICGTNYPVITEQGGFMKLAQAGGGEPLQLEVYRRDDDRKIIPGPKAGDLHAIALALRQLAGKGVALDRGEVGRRLAVLALENMGDLPREMEACVAKIVADKGLTPERARRLCNVMREGQK